MADSRSEAGMAHHTPQLLSSPSPSKTEGSNTKGWVTFFSLVAEKKYHYI